MTLGSNEKLLKVYNYGSKKARDGNDTKKENYSLTVTNKRIIVGENTKKGKCATEIRMCDVKAVSYGIKVVKNALYLTFLIICAVLTAALFTVAFVVFGNGNDAARGGLIAGAVVLLLLTIVFLLMWLFKKVSAFYLMFFVTDEYNVAAQIVATNNKLGFDKLDNNYIEVKMKVNYDVAQHMVDEIGSIIIDCQSGKM